MRRPQAAAVDPVGIDAVLDQVPMPAVAEHRRGDRGRGRAPAIGIGVTHILFRRRAQRQPAAGVPLLAAPVPGNVAPVHEDDPRGLQASSGERACLGGNRNALGPGTYNGQRRHDGEDNPHALAIRSSGGSGQLEQDTASDTYVAAPGTSEQLTDA